jgi:phosphoheptose isomerase
MRHSPAGQALVVNWLIGPQTLGLVVRQPIDTVGAAHFRRSLEALERAAGDAEFMGQVLAIAAACERALREGGKLLLAGNGGGAADAQHIAGEFLSRLRFDRNPLPAIALTTDSCAYRNRQRLRL